MNTTEIKILALGLIKACENLEEAEANYQHTKVSEYYRIFGCEPERQKDLFDAENLIALCEDTLKRHIRIIGMTEGVEA